MATIKSYTDIEQSKKLAEILPLESADMCYIAHSELINIHEPFYKKMDKEDIPCLSLAVLLSVLPKGYSLGRRTNGKYYVCMTNIKHNISEFDNPVDACVAMIEKLHELNLL